MPEVLKKFLAGLTVKQAEEVFKYFDGDPSAVDTLLANIAPLCRSELFDGGDEIHCECGKPRQSDETVCGQCAGKTR